MSFTQRNDVISTLAPDRSDYTLDKCVLPRRTRSTYDLLNAKRLDALLELLSKDRVTIAVQVLRRIVVRTHFDHLTGRPSGGRVGSHIRVTILFVYRTSLKRWSDSESNRLTLSRGWKSILALSLCFASQAKSAATLLDRRALNCVVRSNSRRANYIDGSMPSAPKPFSSKFLRNMSRSFSACAS
ncbi:MAG: hypothetical protein ACI8X5_004161 [Planctomycetota bacterium]|jgi:hypothetical protein